MKYLISLLALFALCLPASAQCPCGTDCKCNPCLCTITGKCACGASCACAALAMDSDETTISGGAASSAAASLAALMAKVNRKSDSEVYSEAYAAALVSNKVLVIGVGCDTPPGDWLSCRVEELGSYAKGTVLVAKKEGDVLNVKGKLLAGASTSAVVQALEAKQTQPPMYQPQQYAMQQMPVMMGGMGGFGGMMGGGCAGGSCR